MTIWLQLGDYYYIVKRIAENEKLVGCRYRRRLTPFWQTAQVRGIAIVDIS
jgi:hypothetical protein